jgi:hypothetical protein
MSAEKQAQRINDTLDMADVLLRAVEPLLFDASGLLADDEPEAEAEAEDARTALAREIPDEIWVWGPDDDEPLVWKACVRGETAPVLDERGFRGLFKNCLDLRIRAWLAWERDNPDVASISEIVEGAFGGGHLSGTLAAIVMNGTRTSLLLGGWSDYWDDISWPVTMRIGSEDDVERFREQLDDDSELGSLLEFWGRGPSET